MPSGVPAPGSERPESMEILRGKIIQGAAFEVKKPLPFSDIVLTLFRSDDAEDDAASSHGWQNSSWIYPRAMQFLEVSEYRPAVLSGLLISIGSKTDSTVNKSRFHRRRRTSGMLMMTFVSNVTSAIA